MADLGNAAILRETLARVAEGPVSLQHAVNANDRQNDDYLPQYIQTCPVIHGVAYHIAVKAK